MHEEIRQANTVARKYLSKIKTQKKMCNGQREMDFTGKRREETSDTNERENEKGN